MEEVKTGIIESVKPQGGLGVRKKYIISLEELGVIDRAMSDVFLTSGTPASDIHTYARIVARGLDLQLKLPPPPHLKV